MVSSSKQPGQLRCDQAIYRPVAIYDIEAVTRPPVTRCHDATGSANELSNELARRDWYALMQEREAERRNKHRRARSYSAGGPRGYGQSYDGPPAGYHGGYGGGEYGYPGGAGGLGMPAPVSASDGNAFLYGGVAPGRTNYHGGGRYPGPPRSVYGGPVGMPPPPPPLGLDFYSSDFSSDDLVDRFASYSIGTP